MASSKEYLDFVLEQLSPLGGVTYRPMMGEFVIYYNGVVIGGVYDDRFLVKPTVSALDLIREAGRVPTMDAPYPGAKPMLTVDIDDRELTCKAAAAVCEDLAKGKKGRK